MTWTPLSSPVRRETVEPILAVVTVTLAAVWVTEPGFVFDGEFPATIVTRIFIPATHLVPGLLAVSVLARVVRHGVRLASLYVGPDDRAQRGDTNLRRIGTSLVFGGLAGYTLLWVIASAYTLTIGDAGGVILAPLVAVVVGSVLGVLLLARTALALLRSSAGNVYALRTE